MKIGIAVTICIISGIVGFYIFAVTFNAPSEVSDKWYWVSLIWFFVGAYLAALLNPKEKWIWAGLVNSPIVFLVAFLLPVNLNINFSIAWVLPLITVLFLEALAIRRIDVKQGD